MIGTDEACYRRAVIDAFVRRLLVCRSSDERDTISPVETEFVSKLADYLNAEIMIGGTVIVDMETPHTSTYFMGTIGYVLLGQDELLAPPDPHPPDSIHLSHLNHRHDLTSPQHLRPCNVHRDGATVLIGGLIKFKFMLFEMRTEMHNLYVQLQQARREMQVQEYTYRSRIHELELELNERTVTGDCYKKPVVVFIMVVFVMYFLTQ
ncbi:hypothetical protein Tco_0089952 [Tanacetum coccineum]